MKNKKILIAFLLVIGGFAIFLLTKAKFFNSEPLCKLTNFFCTEPKGIRERGFSLSGESLTKSDGRWWLVDKHGNKFFSLGIAASNYPLKTQSLELFQYLKTHGIDEKQYLSDMFGNLEKWGFNSLAGWAPHEFNLALWQKGGEPLYSFITIHTISSGWEGDINFTLKDVNNNPYPSKHTFPDPFNPEWKRKAEERTQEMIAKFKDAPFVMGYFIDNELGFSEFNHYIWSSYSLPEFIKFLREKYNNDIKQLNQRWDANYFSFGEIVDERHNLDKSANPIIRQDIEDFTFKIVEAYIDTTLSLVRKYDDEHLIMSNRFMRWKFEEAKKYLPLFSKYDVIALNWYPRGERFSQEDLEIMAEVYKITGRPIIISEWSIGAQEGFSIGEVSNQQERDEAYKTCLTQLLKLPFVIGAHWFRMTDQIGVKNDQETARNLGLIDSEYKPYPLTSSFADFHSQINKLRGLKK
jgi:hypothetical protein